MRSRSCAGSRAPHSDRRELIQQIVEWSNIARRQGLLGLESQVEAQQDPFLRKGLQLLVDGVEPESMRHMLEIELGSQEHRPGRRQGVRSDGHLRADARASVPCWA
jgi:flagellar motor component MotA